MIIAIGLGSNLGKPVLQLHTALAALANDADLKLLKISAFYQSAALTLPDAPLQNDYINAAAMLETALSADKLLHKLNVVEASQGRERNEKWGARTLDLDILLYGDQCIKSERLTIPHSQIKFRNFVIHPLYEVAGNIEIPALGSLKLLANHTSWDGLEKLDSSIIAANN